MADYTSISSPRDKYNKKATSFPKLFTGFTFKNFSEESVMSPTSILDSKPFSGLKNPFCHDLNPSPKNPEPETRRHWDKSKGIGLGIIDVLTDEKTDSNLSKPESRMVLFGSQLKIQIPPLPPSIFSPAESPKSSPEIGIKTKNSQLGSYSSELPPSPAKTSEFGSANSFMDIYTPNSSGAFTEYVSATEMELSEDYTCVISHGPNPVTTHIFDNCIIESCCGVVGFSVSRKENLNGFLDDASSYPSESYTCKRILGWEKTSKCTEGEKHFAATNAGARRCC